MDMIIESADLQRKIKELDRQLDQQAKQAKALKDLQAELSKAQKARKEAEAEVEKHAQAKIAAEQSLAELKNKLIAAETNKVDVQTQVAEINQLRTTLDQEKKLREAALKRFEQARAAERALAKERATWQTRLSKGP